MRMRSSRAMLLLALSNTCFVASPVLSPHVPAEQPKLVDSASVLALKGATVIDGTGALPRPRTLVVLEGGRIAYVGDPAGVRLGPHTRVVDLAGRWVLPGFIDTHVHLPGADGVTSFLTQLLAFGTTTICAAANPRVELRELIARGTVTGPRLLVAGTLIDGKESVYSFAARVASETEIRDVVRRQAAEKIDFIKLYVGLPPGLVQAAVDEAHRHDLRVIGHLGQTMWMDAAGFGIDLLAHSWYSGLAHSIVPRQHRTEFRDFYIPNTRFDPALFRRWREIVDPHGPEVTQLASLLNKRRISVAPNLVLGEAVTWGDVPAVLERLEPAFAPPETAASWRRGPHPYSAGWSSDARAEAKRAFPVMVEVIRQFHESGVLLTAGSDYMNPWMTPGVAFHRELELLVSGGITPLDVLRIATRNGAEALGILPDVGTIEVGKRADLVVLTADPLKSVSNTRKIERVYLKGMSFEPRQLLGIR
jgi:imidazolonepropionase-like amidohydrolase